MPFEWSSSLETGHADIDEQHRGIFALANRLADAIDRGTDDEDAIADAVYGLTDYVVEHFADEEALMTESGYPEASSHRSVHEHLTAATMSMAARFFNGNAVAAEELGGFVTEWLRKHIGEDDQRFVTWLRSR
ncbi:MAG: hemerythrin family protein [Coriobacteriia bacterium]